MPISATLALEGKHMLKIINDWIKKQVADYYREWEESHREGETPAAQPSSAPELEADHTSPL